MVAARTVTTGFRVAREPVPFAKVVGGAVTVGREADTFPFPVTAVVEFFAVVAVALAVVADFFVVVAEPLLTVVEDPSLTVEAAAELDLAFAAQPADRLIKISDAPSTLRLFVLLMN